MRVLVTGGAGFVGTNLVAHLAAKGAEVVVLDNLSRRGVDANAEWLKKQPGSIRLIEGDVRDAEQVAAVCEGADQVFHLAAQVAVTTSVTDPRTDFEINLLGAFNVLEGVRAKAPGATVFFTSTNKVYGGLEDVDVALRDDRYVLAGLPLGVSEERPLDFHSPYGCSKGAADQYMRDYSRIYGLRTVVFRMSCIYGPHQCGNEDQGWVAHFARQALEGGDICLYGDGKQVRDVLFVQDLVRAFELAGDQIGRTAGRIYNIGGGPANTISLLELIDELGRLCGHPVPVSFSDWRPGDQRVYVSDIRLAEREFGWAPQVSKQQGVARLVDWLRLRVA